MDFDFEEGEDPGPGNIGVIISGHDTRHEVSKRSLASKSQYFRSGNNHEISVNKFKLFEYLLVDQTQVWKGKIHK